MKNTKAYKLQSLKSRGNYYNPYEKIFKWNGYVWRCDQLGNIPLHFDSPHIMYDPDMVKINNNGELELSVGKCDKKFNLGGAKIYTPKIGVGLIRCVSNFSHGIYTIKAKLPSGRHLWPAFWNWGIESWPPEIDWMEGWTNCFSNYYKFINKYKIQTAYSSINAGDLINTAEFINTSALNKPHKEFNKYQMVWLPDKIEILYNDKIVRSITGNDAKRFANKTMCLILNVHVSDKFNPDKHEIKSPLILKEFKYSQL